MKNTRETLALAASDGDSSADAAEHDMAEEFPLETDVLPGKWYAIFTATFYHVGILLKDTHEYLILEPGSGSILDSCGPYADFYGQGLVPSAGSMEMVPTVKRIRKGIITEVNDWPFKRLPRPKA